MRLNYGSQLKRPIQIDPIYHITWHLYSAFYGRISPPSFHPGYCSTLCPSLVARVGRGACNNVRHSYRSAAILFAAHAIDFRTTRTPPSIHRYIYILNDHVPPGSRNDVTYEREKCRHSVQCTLYSTEPSTPQRNIAPSFQKERNRKFSSPFGI